MNQIPQGEYCGDCPCHEVYYTPFCKLFRRHTKRCTIIGVRSKRLPQCLKRRPRIVEGSTMSKKIGPIVIGEHGETLRGSGHSVLDGYKPWEGFDPEQELSISIGVHDVCEGFMETHAISDTHRAIICRQCRLRVVFPKWVKTYGDLKKWSNVQVKVEDSRR